MNRFSVIGVVLLTFAYLAFAAADEPMTSPSELVRAINEGTKLLEAGDKEKFLDRFISPDRQERFKANGRWQKVVDGFTAREAELLLEGFKAIETAHPEISKEGTRAQFTLPKDMAEGISIGFDKVDDVWYMRN